MFLRFVVLVGVLLAGLLITSGQLQDAPPFAKSAVTCDRYASPAGSDSASGSATHPVASVAELDARLASGQTGCLLSGTYGGTSTIHRLTNSGSPAGQIMITVAPGQSAKILGLVELEGSYTTLTGLTIDGSNDLYKGERPSTNCPHPVSNGMEIDGHDDVLQYSDYYQSIPSLRGNGIGIGWNGVADGTIIRYNRIHDVGQCQAYDQLIYLAHGDGVRIYDNWLWNDPHGWGVQVYPAAADARIYDNVIDHAGSGFVVGGGRGVSGNVIDHNVVMNSTGLPAAGLAKGVGLSSTGYIGDGNAFTDNDVYNDPGGIADADGVALSGNKTTAPGFADAGHHVYEPTAETPALLAQWRLWDGVPGGQ